MKKRSFFLSAICILAIFLLAGCEFSFFVTPPTGSQEDPTGFEDPTESQEDPTESENPTESEDPTESENPTESEDPTESQEDPTGPSSEPVNPGDEPTENLLPDPAVLGFSVENIVVPYLANEGPLIVLNAGHQQRGDSNPEPIGPGTTITKARLATGTQGAFTRVSEYEVNLAVSLKLRDLLLQSGYRVVMIRETNDCPLSNRERALVSNYYGADAYLHIHCNGSEDPSMHGLLAMVAGADNAFVPPALTAESTRLATLICGAASRVTGARNIGPITTNEMCGINWCQSPNAIIEMGYMSNETEDYLLVSASYQEKLAQGILNGLNQYFGR